MRNAIDLCQALDAGQAGVLVVPDLESGNMPAWQLEYLADRSV